jgi:hypothetical protein
MGACSISTISFLYVQVVDRVMTRTGIEPIWRLRHAHQSRSEVVMPPTPGLLIDDMVELQQAAIKGLGTVASLHLSRGSKIQSHP